MDQVIDLSPLFHGILETKSHALNCVETPVSSTELTPASSDGSVKEKKISNACLACSKMFSQNSKIKRHMRIMQ